MYVHTVDIIQCFLLVFIISFVKELINVMNIKKTTFYIPQPCVKLLMYSMFNRSPELFYSGSLKKEKYNIKQ